MIVAFWVRLASLRRSVHVVVLRRFQLCHHSRALLCRKEVRHSVSLELTKSVVRGVDLPRHVLTLAFLGRAALGARNIAINRHNKGRFDAKLNGSLESRLHNLDFRCIRWTGTFLC